MTCALVLLALAAWLEPLGLELVYEDSLAPAADLPLGKDRFWYSEPTEWSFRPTVADNGLGAAVPDAGPCLTFRSTAAYRPRVRSPHSLALLRGFPMDGAFAFEVEAMQTGVETPHRDLVLFFGFESPERFFYAHLGMVPDATSSNVFEVNGTARRRVGEIGTKKISWGRGIWHQLRVECSAAGHLRVYLDGSKTPHFEEKLSRPATGLIGFGSFDDAGAFRNLRVFAEGPMPAGDSWRSSPFGGLVHCDPLEIKTDEVLRRVDRAGADGQGSSPVLFERRRARAGRREHWILIADADEDGVLGSPGTAGWWTTRRRRDSFTCATWDNLGTAFSPRDDLSLGPQLGESGSWPRPFQLRLSIPKKKE